MTGKKERLPAAPRRAISGWGRHPVESCALYRPGNVWQARSIVAAADAGSGGLVPRGLGRSYGDAALNARGAVLLSAHLDHLLDFDESRGLLRCEAGVSLAEILEHFLPRGFFFPVTPGTKSISVGGAIAADVHGKNHHRSGSMSAWIERFRLLTGRDEILECSREEHSEIFWGTLGGMGLTGLVLDAELRLLPVESAYVEASYEKLPNIDRLLERMDETESEHEYSVAWLDGLCSGSSLGRSILMQADHAPVSALPGSLREAPFDERGRWRPGVPFTLPDATLNRFSMRLFNSVFHALHRNERRIVGCDRFFYPLDAVSNWNRVYGRRGVLQYQCVIPEENAREGLIRLLEVLTARGLVSFLSVLKSLGPASPAPLGFPLRGKTLSLDLPFVGPELVDALRSLDEIVISHGGRVYLAKDACLTRSAFVRMYPELPRFREIRSALDPEGRFVSSLARRLGIVPEPA